MRALPPGWARETPRQAGRYWVLFADVGVDGEIEIELDSVIVLVDHVGPNILTNPGGHVLAFGPEVEMPAGWREARRALQSELAAGA